MRRWAGLVVTGLLGGCGLTAIPMPWEEWHVEGDEQTATQTAIDTTDTPTDVEEESPTVVEEESPTEEQPTVVEEEQPTEQSPTGTAPVEQPWKGGKLMRLNGTGGLALYEGSLYVSDGQSVWAFEVGTWKRRFIGSLPDSTQFWSDRTQLVVGGGYVYVLRGEARQILRKPLSGGAFEVYRTTQRIPYLMALVHQTLYWSEDIYEPDLWRDGPTPERVYVGQDGPIRLAVAGTTLYWLGHSQRTVHTYWSDTRERTSEAVEGQAQTIAADGAGFYVVTYKEQTTEAWAYLADGPRLLGSTSDTPPYFMMVAPDALYWTASKGGFWKAPRQPQPLARRTTSDTQGAMLADSQHLYWIGRDETSFYVEATPIVP